MTFPANAHLRHKTTHMKKLILILLCALTRTVVAQAQNKTFVLKPVNPEEEPQAGDGCHQKGFSVKSHCRAIWAFCRPNYEEEWSADFKDNLNGAPRPYRVNLKEGNRNLLVGCTTGQQHDLHPLPSSKEATVQPKR